MKQEYTKSLFNYKDGVLSWKIKRRGTRLDKSAGGKRYDKYSCITIDGKQYLAHRVIYLYHNVDFNILDISKFNQIDHINGIKSDNRIENLRVVTSQENHFNRHTNKGYSYEASRGKWRASIYAGGKGRIIGRYNTEDEAREAYLCEKRKLHIIKGE